MVRDRRFKYVWNPTAEDEFYDLAVDPGERRNRIREESVALELRRMRSNLFEWMQTTRDPFAHHWTRVQLLEGRKK